MDNLKDIIKNLISDNEELYSQPCEVLEVDKSARTLKVEPLNGDADIFDVRLQSKESSGIGLVLFPKIGSQVIVTFLSKDLAFVTSTDEVEEVSLRIGEFDLFIDAENFNKSVKNIVINNDNFEQTSKNVKFTVQSLFEVESAADLKLKAITAGIEAAMVDIKGVTSITGATTITGAVAIAGAVAMNGGANGGVPKSAALASEFGKVIVEVNKIKKAFADWSPVREDGGAALKGISASFSSPLLPVVAPAAISNDMVKH